MSFSTIAIIFNPNSTGSSEKLAKDFGAALNARLPKQKVEIIPTTHAGHAETLAYDIATKNEKPLIISSSGDGGYHEVINGVVQAKQAGHEAITSVLPAGNANDHYRTVQSGDLVELIANEEIRSIDLLAYAATQEGKPVTRYAHSYIGLGLTPDIGHELNKKRVTILNEAIIVLKAFFSLRPVPLVIDGVKHAYDSLIFSNIASMSKILKVSENSQVNDGKFEVSVFRRRHKLQLIAMLLHASLVGIKQDKTVSRFTLMTVRKTPIQADGEIAILDAKTTVTVTVDKHALRCIL
jgi:diacylglycerol kinase family enzyme